MPRPPREHASRSLYHVDARTPDLRALFRDVDDKLRFFRIVAYAAKKHGWLLRAYCLMTTHYHLLVWIPDDELSRSMQLVNGLYAQTFNKRYERYGHVFAARFSSRLVKTDEHAMNAARYIVRNPVEAGICSHPSEYRWSSYGATVGTSPGPWYFDPWPLLACFAPDPFVAIARFRRFVDDEDVSGEDDGQPSTDLEGSDPVEPG